MGKLKTESGDTHSGDCGRQDRAQTLEVILDRLSVKSQRETEGALASEEETWLGNWRARSPHTVLRQPTFHLTLPREWPARETGQCPPSCRASYKRCCNSGP